MARRSVERGPQGIRERLRPHTEEPPQESGIRVNRGVDVSAGDLPTAPGVPTEIKCGSGGLGARCCV